MVTFFMNFYPTQLSKVQIHFLHWGFGTISAKSIYQGFFQTQWVYSIMHHIQSNAITQKCLSKIAKLILMHKMRSSYCNLRPCNPMSFSFLTVCINDTTLFWTLCHFTSQCLKCCFETKYNVLKCHIFSLAITMLVKRNTTLIH